MKATLLGNLGQVQCQFTVADRGGGYWRGGWSAQGS